MTKASEQQAQAADKKRTEAQEARRATQRFELACSAIAGVGLHQLDHTVRIAKQAVAIADAVLDVLDGTAKDVPFTGRAAHNG